MTSGVRIVKPHASSTKTVAVVWHVLLSGDLACPEVRLVTSQQLSFTVTILLAQSQHIVNGLTVYAAPIVQLWLK